MEIANWYTETYHGKGHVEFGCKLVKRKELIDVKQYLQKKGGSKTIAKLQTKLSPEFDLKYAIKTKVITTTVINTLLKEMDNGGH